MNRLPSEFLPEYRYLHLPYAPDKKLLEMLIKCIKK